MLLKKFHYISKEDSIRLIDSLKNIKHKVITLLMLDAGLRVSEACKIKFKNFDFKNRLLTVESLKKRDTKSLRTIPISNRLYRNIGEYINSKKTELKPDNYLFPSHSKTGHIGRRTIWRVIKRHAKNLNINDLHPHTLRHSFATHHLSSGTSLEEIKEMLGHKSYNTTLIYAEIPTEKLKERVNAVTDKNKNIFQKIYLMIIPEKKTKLINLDFSDNYFTIGRNTELTLLKKNIDIQVNTLVIGKIGVGKSHLLQNLQTNKKILKLDDTEAIKKSLALILLYFHKNKETVNTILWKNFTDDEIIKKIQRDNITNLCQTIKATVKEKEYILLIDDISAITNSAKKVIEKLKDTFIIIAGARQVKAINTSFVWNFEKVEIKPLNRQYSMQLIQQLSNGLQVENWELFRNHIFDQSNGNPRAITEMINRYKKEPFLDNQTIREIKHFGALQEFDMTWLIIMFLGIITAMRYMARELDEPALRFIGSIGLILLLVSRPLFRSLGKKFI